jgi:hypothetical protein
MGSIHDQKEASFETTKRLLAQLVNEGQLRATLCRQKKSNGECGLRLTSNQVETVSTTAVSILVQSSPDAHIQVQNNLVQPVLWPAYLRPPVILELANGDTIYETDPAEVFRHISRWLSVGSLGAGAAEKIAHELGTTADNQGAIKT